MGTGLIHLRRRRATTPATERLAALRAGWRVRWRLPVALALGAVLVLAAVMGAVGDGGWDLAAALLVGWDAGVATWVWVGPPAQVERRRSRGEGHRRTAQALAELPAGWAAVHGVRGWDHVVAGPTGVYLLDTKHPDGTASVSGDVLELRRPEAPDVVVRFEGLTRRLRGAAAELAHRLADPGTRGPFVRVVVVVWPVLDPPATTGSEVTYVAGDRLLPWLLAQPALRRHAGDADLAADLERRLRA